MGMKENLIQVLLVSRRNDLASSNTKIKIFPCLKDASKKSKDAGFVHESLRIETNRVI